MITLHRALLLTLVSSSVAFAGDPAAPPAEPAPAPTAAPTVEPPAPVAPAPIAAPAPIPAPMSDPAPAAESRDYPIEVAPNRDPKFGLEAHIGVQGTEWSSFHPNGRAQTVGITGRMQFTRALALDLGVTHSYEGGTRYFYAYDEESDEDVDGMEIHTTMVTERLDLGLRAELPISEWVRPYAKVAGVGALHVARLDEDIEDPENTTALSQLGLSGGVYVAGGVATPLRIHNQIHFVPSMELGYSLLTPVGLGDLGSVKQGGLTFRFSAGVSF